MSQGSIAATFERLDRLEVRLCRPVNAVARWLPVRSYFRLVSRLGDGPAWYALVVLLPVLPGAVPILASIHMAATGLAGVLLYRLLKNHLVRERPFFTQRGIRAFSVPLDRYSFPSGHTLHATCFTTMVAAYYPAALPLVLPFAASVALSRVVLGLHYPSDVLAGGVIGWLLAMGSLAAASVALGTW